MELTVFNDIALPSSILLRRLMLIAYERHCLINLKL